LALSPYLLSWILFFALAIGWQWREGLHRHQEVKLRSRIGYGAFVSTGFLLFWLLNPELRPTDFTLSLIAGTVWTILFLPYSIRRLRNGIQGNVMRYPRRSRWYYALALVVPVLLFAFDPIRLIIRFNWFLLGLLLAWCLSSIFEYIYVLRLESRLGTPITEQQS
jgi:hypothetical protein